MYFIKKKNAMFQWFYVYLMLDQAHYGNGVVTGFITTGKRKK